MSRLAKLERCLRGWLEWHKKADQGDGCDYLNGKGWDDADALASTTMGLLASPRTADAEPGDRYLITKNGAYYRPNAQGYTTSKLEAGRYTLEEAIAHSHPNGPDGPRDGISYELDDAEPGGDVVERVAKAFCCPDGCMVAGTDSYCASGGFEPNARAAIAALNATQPTDAEVREVVEALRKVGSTHWHNGHETFVADELSARAITLLERIAPAAVRREALEEAFCPMETWDKRDETVLLLVDYTDGDHPLDDAVIAITIGHNNDHNIGDDEPTGWQFAGWCWAHDHYVQGSGKPIGWMPLPHNLAIDKYAAAAIRQHKDGDSPTAAQ